MFNNHIFKAIIDESLDPKWVVTPTKQL